MNNLILSLPVKVAENSRLPKACPLHPQSFLRISFFHFFSQKKNDICKPIYYIWVHSTE